MPRQYPPNDTQPKQFLAQEPKPHYPRAQSAQVLPQTRYKHGSVPYKELDLRQIRAADNTGSHVPQHPQLKHSLPPKDSRFHSGEDLSPHNLPPAREYLKQDPLYRFKLSVDPTLIGPSARGFPSHAGFTASSLASGEWFNDLIPTADREWLTVSLIQDKQRYDCKPGQPCPVSLHRPTTVSIQPSAAYMQQKCRPLPKLLPQLYYTLGAKELASLDRQINSIYAGKRPAGIVEFPSSFDPRLNSSPLFPGLDACLFRNPFGPGIAAILSRRDEPQALLRANRLKESLRKEWAQTEADIKRGVPKETAILQSRIRNYARRSEHESIDSDSAQFELAEMRLRLSKMNRTQEQMDLTPAQRYERDQAVRTRVKERFNNPGEVRQKLTELSKKQTSAAKRDYLQQLEHQIDIYEQRLQLSIPYSQHESSLTVRLLLDKNAELQSKLREVTNRHWREMSDKEVRSLSMKKHDLNNDRLLLLQVLDSPARSTIASRGMSWQSALEFRRVGYPLDEELTVLGPWRDHNLDTQKPPQILGCGKVNTVYRLNYKTSRGTVSRVFKPEASQETSNWINIFSPRLYLNTEHPNLTARNLTTGYIARKLDINVVPSMSFCEHDHKIGLEMELAPGQPAGYKIPSVSRPNEFKRLCFANLFQGGCSKEVQARILAGLADLELLDAICAQPDRHEDNFFIDYESGRVTAIDNDSCLHPFSEIIAHSADVRYANFRKGCRAGFPRLMTRKSFEHLQALDVEKLCESIPSCFDARVKESLKTRIQLIQSHAQALNSDGRVVDNWVTWSHPRTGQSAKSFLVSQPDNLVMDLDQSLKEEQKKIQPLLDRHHQNLWLDPRDKAAVQHFFQRCHLLRNDETNRDVAIAWSYLATAVY